MYVSKSEGNGSFFWHKPNDMNDKFQIQNGCDIVVSLKIGGKFLSILYELCP